jgi:NAD(P)-dependent dehydrogenase (short-subunit alcohol dehydrogenase family)
MSYLEDLFSLRGRVVIVTGGSRGLGRETALGCAQAGAHVVIASRTLSSCEAVVAEIGQAGGPPALAYAVHVGRWDQLEPFVDAVYERFGRVDVLINNAGMSPLYDTPGSVSEKLFDATVNLNFKGPFRLMALVGERMAAAGHGSIINVSSTAAIRPNRHTLPYAGAKAALNALTEGFAQTLGPAVRVNAIMSGPMFTDVSKAWDEDHIRSLSLLALQRGGQPSEFVGAALYLASDASSFTTGAIIRVDGGIP